MASSEAGSWFSSPAASSSSSSSSSEDSRPGASSASPSPSCGSQGQRRVVDLSVTSGGRAGGGKGAGGRGGYWDPLLVPDVYISVGFTVFILRVGTQHEGTFERAVDALRNALMDAISGRCDATKSGDMLPAKGLGFRMLLMWSGCLVSGRLF